MKSKFAFVLSLALLISVVSSYSVSYSSVVQKHNKQTLFFYSDSLSILNSLESASHHDLSLNQVKEYIYNENLLIHVGNEPDELNADGYVFPDQAVQKNKEIQDILKNKLKEGKKIYIYSDGLSIKEFEELIGIENAISPPENTEELKKNSTPTPRYYVASDDQFNVIGYANSNNKFPIYLATYVNQDNIPLLADDYMHLRAIIDHNMKVQSNSSDHSTTNNSAIASSPTIVASQPDISKYVYFEVSGQPRLLKGAINTDWVLKKDNNETDPVYDYFGIEDNIEITSHNGAHSDGATIKHTFPFSSDDIYDWSPSDATNSSQLQVSIGYPSGITLSYTTNVGGRINLRDNGSQTNDIAEWVISTAAFSFDALPNPTRFKPSTTWFSTGTYASIRLTHNVSFWDTLYDYSIDQVITVSYDY